MERLQRPLVAEVKRKETKKAKEAEVGGAWSKQYRQAKTQPKQTSTTHPMEDRGAGCWDERPQEMRDASEMAVDGLALPNRMAADFEDQLQELDRAINGEDMLVNPRKEELPTSPQITGITEGSATQESNGPPQDLRPIPFPKKGLGEMEGPMRQQEYKGGTEAQYEEMQTKANCPGTYRTGSKEGREGPTTRSEGLKGANSQPFQTKHSGVGKENTLKKGETVINTKGHNEPKNQTTWKRVQREPTSLASPISEGDGIGVKRKGMTPLKEIPANVPVEKRSKLGVSAMELCQNQIKQMCVSEMDGIKETIDRPGGLVVPSKGRSGGLALLWKRDIRVEVQTFSENHIDAIIVPGRGSPRWRLTGFYGNPETSKREESWSLLTRLANGNSLPWLCIGDFNELMQGDEKEGGSTRPVRQMASFCIAVNESQLRDLGYVGQKFTWCRRMGDRGWVRERLDRALVSTAWAQHFPTHQLFHIANSASDHCILVLKDTPPRCKPRQRKKLFRFESMWINDESCSPVVEEAWAKVRN
nr:hypothetical protein CFP56_02038 [Quercus suber]